MVVFKRMIDVVGAGLLLLVCSPLLVLLGFLVRRDTPGPALFRQERIGRDKKPFVVLKLRTMQHRQGEPTNQLVEPVLVDGKDKRITDLGRFLRRTSLDELPQLWNILCGDMSLVGPRPILPEQLLALPAEYSLRFAVRPGLTGLAQVRGRRSLDWIEQLQADVEYVRRLSFWLDLIILFRTIGVVLGADGVYDGQARNWRSHVPSGGQAGDPHEVQR